MSRMAVRTPGFGLSGPAAREEDVPNSCADLRLPLAPEDVRAVRVCLRLVIAVGSTASKPDPQYSTPLECLLANLRTLRLKGYIRSKQLTFLCSQAWPQYPLDNGSQWPATGTFDFDILRDLDN